MPVSSDARYLAEFVWRRLAQRRFRSYGENRGQGPLGGVPEF